MNVPLSAVGYCAAAADTVQHRKPSLHWKPHVAFVWIIAVEMHLIVAAGSSNQYQGPVVLLIVQSTVWDRSSARDLAGSRTGAGA